MVVVWSRKEVQTGHRSFPKAKEDANGEARQTKDRRCEDEGARNDLCKQWEGSM